jgi:hypothetical protein
VGEAGPHLLPRDPEPIAVGFGPGLERCQVAPGAGLREPLAPHLLAGEDVREEPFLLFVCSVGKDGRAGHAHTDQADVLRGLGPRQFLQSDGLVGQGLLVSAVRLRPVQSDVAALVQAP